MKKWMMCMLLLAVGLTGCQSAETAVSVPELLEPVEVQVDTAVAEYGDVLRMSTYDGEVVPYVEEISFEVDGVLDEINVIVGEEVKAGQTLATLDTEALREKIESLEEQIEDITVQGDFSDRKAQLEIEIAREQLEIMIIGTDTEEACNAKEIAIEKMEVQLRQAQETRALQLEELNVLLAESRKELNGTAITAPCDGQIVYISSLGEGSQINAFSTVMCIADKERLSLKTDYISPTTVDNAQKIYAKILDKDYDITYIPCDDSEYISMMLSGAEVSSEFTLDNGTEGLECGQFAAIMVLNTYKENVLTIPVNALFKDASGRYVYLIEDGKQVRRNVETGIINTVEAEIVSGLQEGDVVYVKE